MKITSWYCDEPINMKMITHVEFRAPRCRAPKLPAFGTVYWNPRKEDMCNLERAIINFVTQARQLRGFSQPRCRPQPLNKRAELFVGCWPRDWYARRRPRSWRQHQPERVCGSTGCNVVDDIGFCRGRPHQSCTMLYAMHQALSSDLRIFSFFFTASLHHKPQVKFTQSIASVIRLQLRSISNI